MKNLVRTAYRRARRSMQPVAAPTRRLARRLARSWKEAKPSRPQADVWSIGLYTGRSPFDLRPARNARAPALTAEHVSDVRAAYVADPFMVRSDGLWHMYFEVMVKSTMKGVIALATSRDGLAWDYRGIVLEETFHLSYPYAFCWGNDHYMIPESYQANTVRLYKAVDFPSKWALHEILLEGDELVDASPFYFHGTWWMLTSTGAPEFRADTLRLYYADVLTGPWREHPASPVVTGNRHIARPAGRVLTLGGKVYRFAQDCASTYGKLVRAFEITTLTREKYAEAPVGGRPVVRAGRGWNAMGMHHVDPHLREDGSWLACVDGWHWRKTGT